MKAIQQALYYLPLPGTLPGTPNLLLNPPYPQKRLHVAQRTHLGVDARQSFFFGKCGKQERTNML